MISYRIGSWKNNNGKGKINWIMNLFEKSLKVRKNMFYLLCWFFLIVNVGSWIDRNKNCIFLIMVNCFVDLIFFGDCYFFLV